MPFLYHSTRGNAPELDLRGATMAGLASDGGLYLPKTWPQFSDADMAAMKNKSYVDVACTVLHPFVDGVIDASVLKQLVATAYESFNDSAVTPLKKLGTNYKCSNCFTARHSPSRMWRCNCLVACLNIFLAKAINASP